ISCKRLRYSGDEDDAVVGADGVPVDPTGFAFNPRNDWPLQMLSHFGSPFSWCQQCMYWKFLFSSCANNVAAFE
ncbi:hypothetical protein ACJX0J_033528, partial [Zea mays]